MLRTVSVALGATVVALGLLGATSSAWAEGIHRLALQISDSDPKTMHKVLNVAANVSRNYSEKGEEVEVEVIAFNAGLHMLREDTSPAEIRARLKSFSESLPNVTFQACENTMRGMTKKEGKVPPLVAAAHTVPAGVIRLIELSEAGWTIVRP